MGFNQHFQASVHFPLTSAVNKSQQHRNKISRATWLEPGAAGWEARMLPLCCTAPPPLRACMYSGLSPSPSPSPIDLYKRRRMSSEVKWSDHNSNNRTCFNVASLPLKKKIPFPRFKKKKKKVSFLPFLGTKLVSAEKLKRGKREVLE